LSLANKENTVLLVGIGKPAECVAYADPSPPLPYPRLPTWVKNSKYPEAEIRGNLLLFSKAPPKNQAKFQCKYQHHGISVSREFTFEVYELWQLVSNQLKASDSVLQLGEAYQDTCSTKALTRNLKSTTSNFSDLVVEQAAGANFKGNLGIIPPNFPGRSATVTCKAYFLINGVRTPVGEDKTSIELSDIIDVDLNYTNAEGLSPGETVACPDPSTIFLPDDAAWNGFAVQDKRTVQVPQKINTGVHLMGCEVRTNRAWTRKAYTLPIIGYDPILTEDDIVLTPMPLRTIIMFWILWFFVLAFNVAFMAYIFNQNSLYRITQMQVMNRRRTGGTRLNRRMENMPFVYIQRSELDGQLFRRLRLIIDLYRGFLELGDRWLLLWTMNVSPKT
uniref:ZP domain-containing protein n=1 Tax=Schistocephalus solidus TaxID=70667 RepID=A0A183SZE3_SCHSO